MPVLELSFESGEASLSVTRFTVTEAISQLFTVSVWALSPNQDIDLEALIGKTASLHIVSGWAFSRFGGTRTWSGVCSFIEQVQAEPTGHSTYYLQISPSLWLLTHRRNYRVFQHRAIPDIVDEILTEWNITPTWEISRGDYPKLQYKVQYGESDYIFLTRLLEEAGIAFVMAQDDTGANILTLSDKLERHEPRADPPIRFVDNPNRASQQEFISRIRITHEVRKGAYAIRDDDFRNPNFPLLGEAPRAPAPEDRYEDYRYQPGAFLIESTRGGDTPIADDKGIYRHDQTFGSGRAERALLGERADKRSVSFETNALDLHPGIVFTIDNHPHSDLQNRAKLLVNQMSFEGSPGDEWSVSGHAVFTDVRYRPAVVTRKPEAKGVQSAVVVGPKDQEIHADEFGRVRVHFPWDRLGKKDDTSSCWIRVSHGWAGTGFGMITIPRVGQEVLVGFLEADPDQPIVMGRVYNKQNPVPYPLPNHKTRSTWKSNSSPKATGFNEILFEDLADKELVYLQAQKNLRKLVKNDETITVGHDRQKLVKANELETTGANRTEVTGANRTEMTLHNRKTAIGGCLEKLVKGNETERTEGDHLLYVANDQHIIIHNTKREMIKCESHLIVKGSRSESVGGQSLSVGGDQQEKVGNNHALEACQEIHLKAGTALVIEAAADLTLKGPGGFVRIDASGVTISGTIVKINSGGSAGSGSGCHPGGPEKPTEAEVEEPDRPEPDDVSKTGLAQ